MAEKNKSILNRCEDGYVPFFSKVKFTLIFAQECSSVTKDGTEVFWYEVTLANGGSVAKFNAGYESDINKLDIYKEYEFDISYDIRKDKYRIVGVYGGNIKLAFDGKASK